MEHWARNQEETEKEVKEIGRQIAKLVNKQRKEMEMLLMKSLGNFAGPKFTLRKLEPWRKMRKNAEEYNFEWPTE